MSQEEKEKPDSMDDLFKREIYEVIQPYRSRNNIFNQDMFEVDSFREGDRKVILIRRKQKNP